jgi:Ni,Fe-hydrogenase III large subunit
MTELETLRNQVASLTKERDTFSYPTIENQKVTIRALTAERDLIKNERDNMSYPYINGVSSTLGLPSNTAIAQVVAAINALKPDSKEILGKDISKVVLK